MTRRALWPLVSVLTAYLCCQLRRWAALLVIALFPAGGTVLQDATELIVTLPILLVLIHWIAPSVRALSRSPLLLQLQFGMIPLLSYLFDYFTRIYTDLLSSGNHAAVEFMPFVCSLAYLSFVLHTTQEQQLRSQLEQTQNSLKLRPCVRSKPCGRASARPAPTSPATALACAASAPLWNNTAAYTALPGSRISLCCAFPCKRSIQCILWAVHAKYPLAAHFVL